MLRFKTETGSVYELDKDKMTWTRVNTSLKSGLIRGEQGILVRWPEIKVGESAVMYDDSVIPGRSHHAVMTSRVVEIIA